MSLLSRLIGGDEFRKAQEADLPRRLAILTPETTIGWIDVIEQALPLVALETPKRTCDYGPWRKALGELQAPEQPDETYTERFADADSGLINFSTDASKPGWPQDHAHLVEFALRYLEADVMLFRSGYVKRHLLRRLRQAVLDRKQTERAVALIKRVVTHGSGLEEFREFKRLSVRVGDDDLREWLEKMAEGAYVNADHFSGYFHVFHPLLEVGKYAPTGWFQCPNEPAKLDVFSLNVVKKKGVPDDNRIKVNAWCVLNHMRLNER
ncbi:MAG: hypothetical protein ABJF50_02870 [Paracoccaceae bacterium]